MNTGDFMKAWDEAIERVTSNTARESELSEERLNTVAGMSVQSGVKGGRWSNNSSGQFTCGTCTNCADCD